MDEIASPALVQRDVLNNDYLRDLQRYDGAAVRIKKQYLAVWGFATLLTWFTLLLAIAAMALPQYPDFTRIVLSLFVPLFGTLVFLATAVQTLFGLQGRWLKYRGAVERLRETCMLYRARLQPFHGPDADAVLRHKMEDVKAIAETGLGRQFADRFRWRYFLALFRLPPELQRPLPHTPDEGVTPRLDDDPNRGEVLVLEGRLRNQSRWHLNKARTFFRRYLYFQGGIAAVAAFNALWAAFFGKAPWLIAGTTAASLMLVALQDFLGHGPLFQRYVKVAGNLQEIEEAYRRRETPFQEDDPGERLRRLVERTEQTLSSEFQYWYASRN
jgi:cytochrome c biogenesis protein CcdA